MRTIEVGGVPLIVEVADTESVRERGLSGRESLGADRGMLFVLPKPQVQGMWMKDMRFPLDIAWLDAGGVVVSIVHDVAPETYPEVFYPKDPALYVLELPAGYLAVHGVGEGSVVQL